MDIAIIGGTRHLGPDIANLLTEAGHQVSIYSRGQSKAKLPDSVTRVTVDRKVPGQLSEALKTHKPEAVIDMIGFVKADIEEVLIALPALKHYVFCSSTAVYGRIENSTPDESSPVKPYDAYSQGKIDCDQYLLEQYRNGGVPFTSLRLAHPYGPRDHLLYTTGRESLFLDRMRQQRTIIIPGNGLTRIHPIYVTDAARGFVHVLGRSECFGEIYNLSGEEILTLNEYFASIARVLGVPLLARNVDHEFFKDHAPLWADSKRKFDFGFNWINYQSAFDIEKLQQTGFKHLTDHDAGVALSMQWLEENNLIAPSSDHDGEDLILNQLPSLAS